MTIPAFDLLKPGSVAEASEMLLEHGDEARAIAGGTTLVILMKQRALRFSHLVDLQSIPGLERITDNDDGLSIGAMATHRSVERSPLVQRRAPALAQAFSHVGNVRIRETASVGGNLAHADYRLDPPPALLVLDAEVVLAKGEGTRLVPLKDFYRGMYETVLEPGEIVVEVHVPHLDAAARTAYSRFSSLSANDWPCIGVAALLSLDGDDVGELRLGLGGVAEAPLLAAGLDRFRGEHCSEELWDAVCDVVDPQISPVSDLRGSADYKREMTRVWIKRTLSALAAS
ncbi:MAG: xanthine dehydrogenase family protein subunit M [Deltaproteobacteria bacterium]|nr:xanthine dehydrogenase family protein subunit M [Deltaproteobacteria bacterium]